MLLKAVVSRRAPGASRSVTLVDRGQAKQKTPTYPNTIQHVMILLSAHDESLL